MLDVPTLSVAVILVMALSSLALIAHWLANRTVVGMGSLAVGLTVVSVGEALIFAHSNDGSEYWVMIGYICVLLGHMWYWLGLADFWQARTRLLAFVAKAVTAFGVLGAIYLQVEGAEPTHKIILVTLTIAALATGCAYTIFQALGGGLGFYKGIIRRTSVGSAIAAAVFVGHSVYAIYQAMVGLGALPAFAEKWLPLPALAQMEIMLFSLGFAMIVIIITAERLQAELRIQEMLDPLTRALNRRAFIEVVKAVLARARRNAEPVSLLMVDIDKFKRINTKYSRAIGDQILVMFTDMVTEGRRAQDVFCRFGGEEFVFLLPGTPEEGVSLVAKRIKEKIENSSFSPTGVPVKISISMGMVTARGDDLDADGMLDVVDRRMHHAQKLQFEKIESA